MGTSPYRHIRGVGRNRLPRCGDITEAQFADADEVTTEIPEDILSQDLPIIGDIESDVIISPPDTVVGGEVDLMSTTQPLPDGIYGFRNAGNSGRYMDTQYDSSSEGARLQQYAYMEQIHEQVRERLDSMVVNIKEKYDRITYEKPRVKLALHENGEPYLRYAISISCDRNYGEYVMHGGESVVFVIQEP